MKTDGSPKLSRLHRDFFICILLTAATLSVYWQVYDFGFSDYDDYFLISQNPMVVGGLTWQGFLWALQTSYFDFWHPMTWWSQMLDCELFGLNAGWFHLANVGFHLANTTLVYVVLRRMTGAWKRSAIVAALFALHPMHVESVAWLAERKDVLSGFFFLLALWGYICYVERKDIGNPKAKRFYWFVFVFYAFGLMSKSMLVTFPFVLLVLDFWPLKRTVKSGSASALTEQPRPTWRNLILEKLPFFGLTFISCVITYVGMRGNQNILSAETIPWTLRLASLPVSYFNYLAKLFWPINLTVLYPWPSHLGWGLILFSTVLLVAISSLVIIYIHRAPYLASGWCWFLGTLVPVIGIVSMNQTSSISDRYTYIPSIGLFISAVWWTADVLIRGKYKNLLLATIAAVVLLACGYLAWFQIGYWRNGVTLWSHVLAVDGDNAIAEYNLGWEFQHSNQPDKAMECYQAALRLRPDHLDANLNLGIVLLEKGRYRNAVDYFNKALHLNPAYAKAHENLGQALFELRDYDGAIKHCTEAVRLDPTQYAAVYWLAKATGAKSESDEIMRDYVARLDASPLSSEIWYDLGVEWLKRGMDAAAIASFDFAVQQDPASAAARFQLALMLTKTHAIAEAIAQYQLLLKLHPDEPEALNNLAWILATYPDSKWRNGAKAVRLARHACELTSNQETVYLGTLAAAYAENGQFDKAISTAQNACNLAQSNSQTNLFERNQQLLKQYERHEPFRERD